MGELSKVIKGGGAKIYTEDDGLLNITNESGRYNLILSLPDGKTWADIDCFWLIYACYQGGLFYRTLAKANPSTEASGYVAVSNQLGGGVSVQSKTVYSTATTATIETAYQSDAFSNISLRLMFK